MDKTESKRHSSREVHALQIRLHKSHHKNFDYFRTGAPRALPVSQPNTDLDTFMSILVRQICNTGEVVQAFSAFLQSEGGGLFSGLGSLLYQSNLQDIFTLSVLPGAGNVVQPLIRSESTLWQRAV